MNSTQLDKIKESYLNIIKNASPFLIKYVPEEFRTEEMFLIIYNENNFEKIREFIPETLKTKEFYLKVLKTGNLSMSDIPKTIMCREFYLEALKVVPDLDYVLEIMPDRLKNEEFWTEAIRVGFSLVGVPPLFRSTKVCLEAVEKDGTVLQFVPEKSKTLEMCIRAVYKNRKEAVKFVPENIKQLTPSLFE